LQAVFPGLGNPEVHSAHRLREDLGIDSLRMVELLVAIEERIGIVIDESDLDPGKLVTIQDIADVIKKYSV